MWNRLPFCLLLLSMLLIACKWPQHATKTQRDDLQTKPNVLNPTEKLPSVKTKEEAILLGLEFLRNADWQLDFVYLYSYLQPRYGWPNLPALDENARMQDSLRAQTDIPSKRILEQATLFRRLLDPSFRLPKEKLSDATEEDAFTVVALYCDIYEVDSTSYFPILRKEIALGDYHTTHAMLAYLWLLEHGCFSEMELGALRKELAVQNRAIVERLLVWFDLSIEAATLLQEAGESIPSSWIEGVILAQQPDGGWLEIQQHTKSSKHATILALWLLAGYR